MPQAQHTFADSSSSAGTPDEELVNRIHRLEAERRRHVQAIEDIDKVLQQVQHALTDLNMPAIAPPAAQPHRRYQKLELTGEESVLAFIRKRENPTTAEVNAHWHSEGRTGVANPILARLLKRGLLVRENDPTVRGSRYRIKA